MVKKKKPLRLPKHLLLKPPLLKRLLPKRPLWKKPLLLKPLLPKLLLPKAKRLPLLLPSNSGSRNEKPAFWPVFFRLCFAAAGTCAT